jgi:hypothetical protein
MLETINKLHLQLYFHRRGPTPIGENEFAIKNAFKNQALCLLLPSPSYSLIAKLEVLKKEFPTDHLAVQVFELHLNELWKPP